MQNNNYYYELYGRILREVIQTSDCPQVVGPESLHHAVGYSLAYTPLVELHLRSEVIKSRTLLIVFVDYV